jgi:hypothetical protein
MAVKRHCESKSHLTATGSSLRFIGAAKSPKLEQLKRALNFYLHYEIKGDDLIAYYQDDFYKDDLEFMRERYGNILGALLLPQNVKKNANVVLAKVLPERLPMQGNKTWAEIFARSIESTERDDNGSCLSSRTTGGLLENEQPDIVRVFSQNEYRTNGHF